MCQIKDMSKQDVVIGEAAGSGDCCPPGDGGAECCAPLACEPLPESGAQELALLFKAVADPVRLRLLSLIACHDGGESCVCDLLDAFDMTPPSVSYHLKILREAGLLSSRAARHLGLLPGQPGRDDAHVGGARPAARRPGGPVAVPGLARRLLAEFTGTGLLVAVVSRLGDHGGPPVAGPARA